MGDKWEGRVRNIKKCVTSFIDSLLQQQWCLFAYLVQFLFLFIFIFLYFFSDIEEYEKWIKVLKQEYAEMKAAGKSEFGIGK